MFIFRAASEDYDLLAKLDMEIFPENCFNEVTLGNEVARGGGFIAKTSEDEVAGYSIYRDGDGLVDILRLGVREAFRGNGVGARLLRVSISVGTRGAMLTVAKDNTPAINLYKKYGFEITGDLAQHNSWVMQLPTSF
jgi:putative acetyltransferase